MRKTLSHTEPASNNITPRRASFAQIKTGVKTLLALLVGTASLSAAAFAQTA
jgi:hypothetical protein